MSDVYVIGVGMTRFEKNDLHFRDMGRIAVRDAIKDAGIDENKIQVAYAGHARTGKMWNYESGVGQAILWDCGINKIPVISVGNYCSSGTTAIREAWIAIKSGLYDVAIALGVEKLSGRKEAGKPLTSDGVELETGVGFTPPTFFAMAAQRHMYEYGTTLDQMARVSVKNRMNGSLNPRAQYRKEVSMGEVLNSKDIVSPLTILQCAPISDGAAAAIICSERFLKKHTTVSKPIKIAACSLVTGSYTGSKGSIAVDEPTIRAAKEAYEFAGIEPTDVNIAEVHDCFTIAEIMHYEDLGFCKKGEGGYWLEKGRFDIGGDIAVNTSGGLLSKGHPLGATGVGQLYEVAAQLRGLAGSRQHANSKVGLTHTAGGFKDADAASIGVNIFTI